jgi:hypothetical protein
MRTLVMAILLSQAGCAVIATSAGGSAAVVQAAQVLDIAKLSADLVSGATTGKTLTDHAISYVRDQDCSTLNLLAASAMCEDYSEDSEQQPEDDANSEENPH